MLRLTILVIIVTPAIAQILATIPSLAGDVYTFSWSMFST